MTPFKGSLADKLELVGSVNDNCIRGTLTVVDFDRDLIEMDEKVGALKENLILFGSFVGDPG